MIIPTHIPRDGAQSQVVPSNCRVVAGVKLCVEDIVVLGIYLCTSSSVSYSNYRSSLVVLVVFILYAIWGVPLTIRLVKLLQRRLGREAPSDILPPGQSSDPYQNTTSIDDSVILKKACFKTPSSPDAAFFPDPEHTLSCSKVTTFDIHTHSRQESGHGLGFGNSVSTEPSNQQSSTESRDLQIQELFHPPPAYMQHLEEKILF